MNRISEVPFLPAGRSRKIPVLGHSRVDIVLALLVVIALLASSGALWMAWQARDALLEAKARLASDPSQALDAELSNLKMQTAGLREQLQDLAKVVEGPMGHLVNSYQRDMEQLQARVAQLEDLAAASGPPRAPSAQIDAAVPSEGDWLLHLSSSDKLSLARQDLARATAAGLKAELTTTQKDGRTWYRVTLARRFATLEQARAQIATAAQLGFFSAWASRPNKP